jgi:signal transduction histidine kinase
MSLEFKPFFRNVGAILPSPALVFACFCVIALLATLPGALRADDSLSLAAWRVLRAQTGDRAEVDMLNRYAMRLHETYPDSTRLIATAALRIADSLGYSEGRALSLNGVGVSYFIQNNYEKALEYYLQALQLREKLSDMKGVAGTLNNIGMVYRDMQEHANALSYYFRALRLNDSLGNTPFLVRNLNNIGVAFESLNKFDSALAYHRRSLELKRSIGDKAGIASSLRNIGKVHTKLRQYPEALKFLREALAMEEAGKQVKALILLDMSRIYAESRQYAQAVSAAKTAMTFARELGSALILQDAHEILSKIYTQTNDHKDALDNYQRFIAIRDSLFNENTASRLAALQTNYELERQRSQIELLTKETQLQNAVQAGLLGAALLMLVLLIVAGFAYRTKRRSMEDLRATNSEILRQQGLLEHQAQEIEITNAALTENNIALATANERLTAINNEKNEIMGIVAHDLKNPIGAVRGLAEMLHAGIVSGDEATAVSGQIAATSERMLDLVRNLLDVNRLESGAMEFTLVRVPITPILENVVWQYREPAAAKSIALHFSADAEAHGETYYVFADEQATLQVLDNLVSNAVKYSPRGKNVFVRVKSTANGVRVEVEDEGPGLSEEDKSKLFGKFARLSARPTGGEHSTGLGLSIVKKMVEAMNGKVWCESELGKGARFIVGLPAGTANEANVS